ncbi:xanthine dehydrogenase family protein molybdopterin-binding subunit [Aquabacterium sp.]|uniref:xanthine dehydrogenase family protein molybdopterin-binding subunit n=1 Tax=Aquabacterium sp. TaxID=1872578 RepID=UPI002C0ADB4C|nr:molybdopterin cofactor-binding domain-containing protein [Aquabacterium sp.]HSW04057.1 molybdopterin cofactor-binding domain-containing protein [Aquabacterium sp.]
MVSRRRVLLGTLGVAGALVIGWSIVPPRQRISTARQMPLAPGQQSLNGWLKIGSDDRVTIMLAKSEMGQGVSTALAMLLAEELDADWSRVTTEMSPVDKIYNNIATVIDGLPFHPDDHGSLKTFVGWMTAKSMREIGLMVTGGSSSIKDLWGPMREAGASARAMLVAAAAAAWRVPAGEITVQAGVLRHAASGKQARFGELAAQAAVQEMPGSVTLKDPARFTLIGQPTKRRDTPAKSDGSARFGLDVLPPGLLYASIVMCPTVGGSVASFDPKAAAALPGVQQVMAVPGLRGGTGGIAVIADTPWHAMQAAKQVVVQWNPGPAAGLDSAALMQQLKTALAADDGFGYYRTGDAAQALKDAARTLTAEYSSPLLAHSTLEPQNCTVWLKDDAAMVWAPTQVPDIARAAAADALGLSADQVDLQVTLLGGGFGRRLEVDFIAQAATVARAVPGQPVQSFWSREQDMTHDFYRPPCVARYTAGFDAQGRLLAWQATSAGPSIVQQYLKRQWGLPGAGPDKTTAEGAFDNPYEWPNARVGHVIVETPVPVGFWRSVGHSHQAFFKESFIDEAAQAAAQDPVAFREALLQKHPRHLQVLRRAAALSGWGSTLPPAADGAKKMRGIALHQSFGSIVAQVAEVSVSPADKQIRVHRVVAVIDCGLAINPNIIRQQMDSGIVFGLTAALYGEITLAKGQVQQSNFHQQALLRFNECPVIETEIIQSAEPPEGVGEPGTPPIAPAVANALFALTGQRLRHLPLRLA